MLLAQNIFKKFWREILFSFLVLVTRIPFASKFLYNWDAVQFALGTEQFDVSRHQPHPPGYILYIGLGKLFKFVFRDINTAFVAISILASIVTVLVFYRFCRELFSDTRVASALSIILIANPYFWYHSEVASTYIFDALFSTLFAYFTLRILRSGDKKYLYWFSFFLAISGGFRQSIILFFLPMWCFALFILLWRKKMGWKHFLTNIAILILTGSLWGIPLLYLSGGLMGYTLLTAGQFGNATQTTSLFQNAGWNFILGTFAYVLRVSLSIVGIGLVIPLFFAKKIRNIFTPDKRPYLLLFAAWLIPSYFFYIFIHFGNPGYLFTVAPALLVLFFGPLYYWRHHSQHLLEIASGLITASAIFLFFFMNAPAIHHHPLLRPFIYRIYALNDWYRQYSYQEIVSFDRRLDSTFKEIRTFTPKDTVLITGRIPESRAYFRHVEYYLPEYTTYELAGNEVPFYRIVEKVFSFKQVGYSSSVPIPQSTKNIIVVFDNIDSADAGKTWTKDTAEQEQLPLFFADVKNLSWISFWKYTLIKTR